MICIVHLLKTFHIHYIPEWCSDRFLPTGQNILPRRKYMKYSLYFFIITCVIWRSSTLHLSSIVGLKTEHWFLNLYCNNNVTTVLLCIFRGKKRHLPNQATSRAIISEVMERQLCSGSKLHSQQTWWKPDCSTGTTWILLVIKNKLHEK